MKFVERMPRVCKAVVKAKQYMYTTSKTPVSMSTVKR
jgi:hypothetical protein